MMSVKVIKDLRSLFGPVRDQGQRPTCLAFAASDHHAALRGEWSPLSCEFLFYHAQQRANRKPTDGAILSELLEALRQQGQPPESVWPYVPDDPTDFAAWLPPDSVAPVFKRAGEISGNTVDAIIAELDHNRPVMTLIKLSHSFDWVGPDGIVDQQPNEMPSHLRRHAVVSVGHGILEGQRTILVRNSWGDGWADGGYAWLTEAFLSPRVIRLAVLKEDLSVSPHSVAA